ncbi:16S rRNA (adenine(1518)-N(6)/adenine(1519)-N(6))-dimethyltransferase RsmA [Fulvivirga lutimaris]|uniref:16S rRNA (adenine(1518)-N(6)/adenine(1519)-N(6))- dimethyltransferase RsmA n=1 Tax=Fulvivirga lutimaris TaxID=1819566 RepID=UPI0012BBCEA9|nr:16S rRNA (adenine(1518)-N(6)/adenine(1519)-N(6))-dimethyltransferase RsmA [Fulvivirga lutimaris]MTI40141.1 16S rRNA (adenine(1518)-N(6)/adenine(1519)-N(6))-dimethyltransferase RsmA [Fulvivirga lutimaris]
MVRAKKHLGQHFLTDELIASDIVKALSDTKPKGDILEIGPGTGVLTKYLIENYTDQLTLIDLDKESIDYLIKKFPSLSSRTHYGDFLRKDIDYIKTNKFDIIGNFPYNISSQIFFKILDIKDRVDTVVCMLQYEVAKRLASPPGNKDYGILSVLLQAYYDFDYLFDVEAHVFDPPPKVRSGVIRLRRNDVEKLDCDEVLFKKVIKQGFQSRRKTLRNALKPLNLPAQITELELLNRRAETLSVNDFVGLTNEITKWNN